MSEKLTMKQFEYLMKAVYRLNYMHACIRFKQPQLIDDFIRRTDVVRLIQDMRENSEAKKQAGEKK